MGNIVAIVGRPNVGKSTFFNRLVGQKDAIVDEQAGVTRDRHYGKAEWSGAEFTVIDTGGFVTNSDDVFEEEIRKQVVMAIEEANVVIFLVDVGSGITDLDQSVAALLRRSKKPVFLVANKVDNFDLQYQASEFYGLGLGTVYTLSAMNGSGSGDLLDDLVKALPAPTIEEDTSALPRIAIVGRPNVGKSSLTNALLGEERNIVTPIAGTTRDSIFSRYKKFGFDFFLIDTAGLRKKGKVTEDLEFYSVMRAIRTIEHADVCLLMLDATQGMEAQDVNIFRLIQRNNKGVVILVNKWDLVEKDTHSAKIFTQAIEKKLAPFNDVPVIFVSALTKLRIQKVLETAMEVFENRKRRIPTSELNEVMLKIIEDFEPPAIKGKYVKIKYVTQLPTHFPSFAFFCNLPQYVKEPYRRFLENRIRETWKFTGNPMQIFFRQK